MLCLIRSTANPKISPPLCVRNAANNIADIALYQSIHDILPELWEHLLPADNFFLTRPYLTAFEDGCCSVLDFFYAVFTRNNTPIALAIFQLSDIKGGDHLRIRDHHKADVEASPNHSWCDSIRRTIKQRVILGVNQLSFRLLVGGNVHITGEHGFYFNPEQLNPSEAYSLLDEAVKLILQYEAEQGRGVSLMLLKDYGPNTIQDAQNLFSHGYREIKALPDMVLRLRPNWNTYDDYLADFSSKYRVRAKSYAKKSSQLLRQNLDLADLTAQIDRFYPLYRQILNNADINIAFATPQYFVELKRCLGDNFTFLAYYLADKPVGFISMIHTPTHTEAHLTGYDEQYNRQHAIYPAVLYDIVQESIARKSPKITFGRTAPEIKSTLGAVGIHYNTFLRHRIGAANLFLAKLVDNLRQDDWTPRHPFKDDNKEE